MPTFGILRPHLQFELLHLHSIHRPRSEVAGATDVTGATGATGTTGAGAEPVGWPGVTPLRSGAVAAL